MWVALGSTVGAFVLVGGLSGTATAAPASLVDETFTGTSVSNSWELPTASVNETNDACLTASSNTGQTPIPGCGSTAGSQPGLQLTTNATQQEGGVVYGSSVPSSLGLDATFNTYQYDGTGADGIVFFLAASDPTNASASPVTLGPPGGNLGYSPSSTADGLTHGYLGIGLDVYGNYTSKNFAGSGCNDTAAFTPESIDVRGPGNGAAGYCMLQTTTLSGSTLDATPPSAVPVEVAINPTNGPLTAAGGFSVPADSYAVQVTPVGGNATVQTGTLPSALADAPDSSWVDSKGVPLQLTFGWSASTGASTDYHTVSNVHVSTLNGTPPALGVTLTDDSGGTATVGQTVNYSATTTVSDANETRKITMTDTFPSPLVPGTATGTGWTCTTSGQTVTCTHDAANIGTLPAVSMPAHATAPAANLANTVTVGSPDATQGTATDTVSYQAVPTATTLRIAGQPVDTQANAAMKNADGSTTHILVDADTAGGAVDTSYNGAVTLGFANNPGGASFVVNGSPTSTLTVNAVNGVADFSPIVVNDVGFGYTLQASATGLTSATTTAFSVNAAATSCPAGQSCTVTATSTTAGVIAQVQAQSGSSAAIITASYGGNVAPIWPCRGASSGILTFGGNRQKVVTLTMQTKLPVLLFCYGQPTPFRDITLRMTTHYNTQNQEYEGLLPACLPRLTGPCIKSLKLSKKTETVVIESGAADPHITR